ncbi:MAG: sugar O-acetyltransferase [Lachnospiraceae bacterium]|nr:sugar O-acetyltransferase [Lachnospiraceae bacterium]
MDYLEIMQKNEPFTAHFMEMPGHLQKKAKRLLRELDRLTEDDDREKKAEILKELFGTYSPKAFPGWGFRCDYGFNIHFHGLAVINYNVVMLDTSPIHIGDGAFIAPGVCLACSGHSLIGEERIRGIGTSAPITLEENVWIGANATVIGGVTIGKGSMIAAGSVVTKDIPAGVVAGGVPCKVIRKITDADRLDV